jgi:hypothetical protein
MVYVADGNRTALPEYELQYHTSMHLVPTAPTVSSNSALLLHEYVE